jgi:hypothetical protein
MSNHLDDEYSYRNTGADVGDADILNDDADISGEDGKDDGD